VSIALEDILNETEQINIPGTTSEHPNWQHKISVSIEELAANAQFARVGEAFAKMDRRIG
jgi:4-alpha-glucanotransferase